MQRAVVACIRGGGGGKREIRNEEVRPNRVERIQKPRKPSSIYAENAAVLL
jgi:hypothetical protein